MAIRTFFAGMLLCVGVAAHASPDTVSVYFRSGSSLMEEAARQRLDSAIYDGRIRALQSLQIIGYADAVGNPAHNLSLSGKRAVIVKEYLVQSGFRAGQSRWSLVKASKAQQTLPAPGAMGPTGVWTS
jgi:outer membrane protein OmpA-like peptidoglycan-associated protein